MRTVLITGVTGFLGRYAAREFSMQGWEVVGLGTQPAENAPRQDLARYYQLVLPSAQLSLIVQEHAPEVCVHCAGRASVDLSMSDPRADFQSAVTVTFELLDTLRQHAPDCRVIFLSSAAVYGNPEALPVTELQPSAPISPYGFHKRMVEQLCAEFHQVYGLPATVIRIFSAYGPGLRRQVIWDMCRKALTQPVLQLQGSGEESRDFIHGRDVARAIYHLTLRAPAQAELYNVASGRETTIRELAGMVLDALDITLPVEFDGHVPAGTPRNWRADISRLTELGGAPEIPLERGIAVYAQWCRAEVVGW